MVCFLILRFCQSMFNRSGICLTFSKWKKKKIVACYTKLMYLQQKLRYIFEIKFVGNIHRSFETQFKKKDQKINTHPLLSMCEEVTLSQLSLFIFDANTSENSPVFHFVESHNVYVPARSTICATFPSANVNSVLPRFEQLVIAYSTRPCNSNKQHWCIKSWRCCCDRNCCLSEPVSFLPYILGMLCYVQVSSCNTRVIFQK